MRRWLWFFVWFDIGAVAAFGFIAILSIGFPLLVVSGAAAAWLLIRRPASTAGVWGLLSGASVVAAFLAVTNREGPGEVCSSTATGGITCTEQWNPWPFAIAAVVLFAAGLALFVRDGRRSRQALTSTSEQ